MLLVQDKVCKLGGVQLPGQVTKIEINEDATIDEAKGDDKKTTKTQSIGYEPAAVTITILFEDTKKKKVAEQIEDVQRLFKKKKQKKPKLMKFSAGKIASTRGISKVYFKNFYTLHPTDRSTIEGKIELLGPSIAGIKVKKKSKKKTSAKKTSKSKKSTAKSPANSK